MKKAKNHTLRNIVAGAAVVGAGVITAKILSDEENRENIGKAIKKGEKALSNLNETKDNVIKRVTQEFEDLKTKIENSKETKDLKKEVQKISDLIKEIQQTNEENFEKLVEQVKSSIEKLKKDFEDASKS